mmetsp:Transcript_44633/g.108925  ORF Transcript_44633/g.108925 Transcript_44633/m.108925 type:complete len:235 (-) Transcript_44633:407-1111(-)
MRHVVNSLSFLCLEPLVLPLCQAEHLIQQPLLRVHDLPLLLVGHHLHLACLLVPHSTRHRLLEQLHLCVVQRVVLLHNVAPMIHPRLEQIPRQAFLVHLFLLRPIIGLELVPEVRFQVVTLRLPKLAEILPNILIRALHVAHRLLPGLRLGVKLLPQRLLHGVLGEQVRRGRLGRRVRDLVLEHLLPLRVRLHVELAPDGVLLPHLLGQLIPNRLGPRHLCLEVAARLGEALPR